MPCLSATVQQMLLIYTLSKDFIHLARAIGKDPDKISILDYLLLYRSSSPESRADVTSEHMPNYITTTLPVVALDGGSSAVGRGRSGHKRKIDHSNCFRRQAASSRHDPASLPGCQAPVASQDPPASLPRLDAEHRLDWYDPASVLPGHDYLACWLPSTSPRWFPVAQAVSGEVATSSPCLHSWVTMTCVMEP